MRLPILLSLASLCIHAGELPGNRLLADYFEREVAAIERAPMRVPENADEWERMRATGKAELAGMLGLSPMPERTPLNATKTGEVNGAGFVVEKLHFQSRPGLYVTANLYRPAQSEGRLPTILYVCGHSDMKGKDGTSLGNKTGYEHHGAWFARHGYVCLVLDTVQLGEIRGEHHGTYSKERWWWISRGYTPAGLEAWSGIRALDYLETRADVDAARIGVTGRSGGGAYSWWIAALDDRVKVVAPTAGITTLRNYVVDGAVAGHCDCMFMVNTRRWDYDRVAALVAPRPLLISNTDKDTIFPLDGVVALHASVRRVYRALGADGKLGLQVAEGPHKDVQPLNVGAFAWFERWLKGADSMAVVEPAVKSMEPESLRVFSGLPGDEINTKADETFVGAAAVDLPADSNAWGKQRDAWMQNLRAEVFGGWPEKPCDLAIGEVPRRESDGIASYAWDFTSQEPWRLRVWVMTDASVKPAEIERVTLESLDEEGWMKLRRYLPASLAVPPKENGGEIADDYQAVKARILGTRNAVAFVCPRGIGPTEWAGDKKEQTQRIRRFYLLGQTLDGMRVWDIRRAMAALRTTPFGRQSLHLRGRGAAGVGALYASLFEDGIAGVELEQPSITHATSPIYLNVLRTLDIPQAVALAAGRTPVKLRTRAPKYWEFPKAVAAMIGRSAALEILGEP